jgi:hypothetical protein
LLARVQTELEQVAQQALLDLLPAEATLADSLGAAVVALVAVLDQPDPTPTALMCRVAVVVSTELLMAGPLGAMAAVAAISMADTAKVVAVADLVMAAQVDTAEARQTVELALVVAGFTVAVLAVVVEQALHLF